MKSQDYWNANLDTDNLSREGGVDHARLDESLALAATPEFEWLLGRLGPSPAGRLLVDLGGGVGMHALLWARHVGEASAGGRVVVADMALERLKRLRQIARRAGVEDRIVFVVARAEDLPFRSGALDVFFTKSVLIHTDLARAAGEIHRSLRVGGQGIFIEPLDRNPIIRLYRRLFAPKLWRSITRYFDHASIEELRRPFGRVRWKAFYLVSAGSFFWQYGFKNLGAFRRSLRRWRRADRWLLKRWPGLESWCWFAAMEVRKEK